jgi:phage shock protein PspC (stress-responsive transcriptional regulator)
MNKVITINLGGTAWQLEEGGYDTLRLYLETAAARLLGNPDRAEILSDIEWAVAEKFRGLLNSHKTVVPENSGPGGAGASGGAGTAGSAGAGKEERAPGAGGAPRRLYRIHEGAMGAGVCSGLAVYLNIDPTFIRLAFVFLALFWGSGVLVYLIMAIVVPEANTPEEKKAACGNPTTAEEFIRRAKEGYYEAMKGFPDRQARREWKRRFKREMRAHSDQWRYNWHSYWGKQAPVHSGLSFTLPLISMVQAAVTIFWICAMVSLLAGGTVFGVALPADMPVWLAAVILFFMFGLVVGPLKAFRHACQWGFGQGRPAWSPGAHFLDAVIWLGVAGVLCWLACFHLSELGTALHALPTVAHQAINDIQTWWKGK